MQQRVTTCALRAGLPHVGCASDRVDWDCYSSRRDVPRAEAAPEAAYLRLRQIMTATTMAAPIMIAAIPNPLWRDALRWHLAIAGLGIDEINARAGQTVHTLVGFVVTLGGIVDDPALHVLSRSWTSVKESWHASTMLGSAR